MVRLALVLALVLSAASFAENSAVDQCIKNYAAWFDRQGARSPHFDLLGAIRGYLAPYYPKTEAELRAYIVAQREANIADTAPANISGFHWDVAASCTRIAADVTGPILDDDALASYLTDGLPSGLEMQNLRPFATAHDTYGVAVSGDGKTALFSEINHKHLVLITDDGRTRRNLVDDVVGLYGVAMDARLGMQGIYIGLDRQVAKDGTCPECGIARLDPATGKFTYVFGRGVAAPRHISVDENGVVYAVFEGGHQIRAWDPRTGQEKLVYQAADQLAHHPQSVLARGGVVYWTEYGTQRPAGRGRLLAAGRVCSTGWKTCLEGVWRARGLAFLGTNKLLTTTESNRADQGNSSRFLEIDLTKVDQSAASPFATAVRLAATGIDYPEYLASYGNRVYVPLGRDNLLMVYEADAGYRPRVPATNDGRAFVTQRKDAGTSPAALQITLNGVPFQASLGTQAGGGNSGWMSIPAALVGGSRVELPYHDNPENPTPGNFAMPTLVCSAYSGAKKVPCSATIVPHRFPGGSRWPMQYPQMKSESDLGPEHPAPGFTEFPMTYWVYYSF